MEIKHHTKDDLINHLSHRLKEELTDVCTYNDLYESLVSYHLYDEADIIEEITRDEFDHATAIYDILKMHGYNEDEDTEALWHKAKMVFHI